MATRRLRTLKIFTVGVLSFLALALARTDAVARDVCLHDQFGSLYVFKRVGALKPKQAIPLVGLYSLFGFSTPDPFNGAATLNAAGTIATFGLFIHSLATTGNNLTVEWTGDKKTFAGAGFYDGSGTYQSAGAITLTAADCKTVTFP